MNRLAIIHEVWRAAGTRPFAWDGRNDCLGFAGDVAQRIVGHDVIADLRGRYSTALGARRVMAVEGWETLADVAAAFFGREVPPSAALNGDWAIILNGDGSETIGVFAGAVVAAKAQSGVAQVPRLRALRAFRVE